MSDVIEKVGEDEDLRFTQSIRRQIASELSGKKDLENSDKTMLVQLLDGMDRQALTIKRLKVEEGVGNKAVAAQQAIANLISQGVLIGHGIVPGAGAIPSTEGKIPEVPILDGELHEGQSSLDYDTFMSSEGLSDQQVAKK